MPTRKALGSTISTPRSKHTAEARGRHQTGGSGTKSKHSAKAMGFKYGKNQGSKGGGTSKLTANLLGKPTRRYERRNSSGRPMAR